MSSVPTRECPRREPGREAGAARRGPTQPQKTKARMSHSPTLIGPPEKPTGWEAGLRQRGPRLWGREVHVPIAHAHTYARSRSPPQPSRLFREGGAPRDHRRGTSAERISSRSWRIRPSQVPGALCPTLPQGQRRAQGEGPKKIGKPARPGWGPGRGLHVRWRAGPFPARALSQGRVARFPWPLADHPPPSPGLR